MSRIALVLALALGAPLAGPATAQGVFVPPPPSVMAERGNLDGRRSRIANELRTYGFDTDVAQLSNRQVSLIDVALHSGRSRGDTQARIKGILTRGPLQRILDRF